MAHIDHEPTRFISSITSRPHAGQTGSYGLVGKPVASSALVVVAQLHEARGRRVWRSRQGRVILNGAGVLEPKKTGRAPPYSFARRTIIARSG